MPCAISSRSLSAVVIAPLSEELFFRGIIYGVAKKYGGFAAALIFNATLFPQQIGMAATFNTTVAMQAGTVTGRETRSAGIPWVFSPILGIAVQPSWARVLAVWSMVVVLVRVGRDCSPSGHAECALQPMGRLGLRILERNDIESARRFRPQA